MCHLCKRLVRKLPDQATWYPFSLQAINELHEDDDFQADASQARMTDVVEEIRADGSALARYQRDEAVLHVLGKLRRFQARTRDPHRAL